MLAFPLATDRLALGEVKTPTFPTIEIVVPSDAVRLAAHPDCHRLAVLSEKALRVCNSFGSIIVQRELESDWGI